MLAGIGFGLCALIIFVLYRAWGHDHAECIAAQGLIAEQRRTIAQQKSSIEEAKRVISEFEPRHRGPETEKTKQDECPTVILTRPDFHNRRLYYRTKIFCN